MERDSVFMDRKTQYFMMSVLPNLVFNTISIKIPANYLDINKLILQFMEKQKTSQHNIEDGKWTILGFKAYCKSKGIQTVWYW